MNLNQVTVPTTDVAASIKFYRTLGLRLIVESSPKYARFECPSGDTTFSLHHTDKPSNDSAIVVYFECEDLDAHVAALKLAGIRFDADPVDQPWLWREAYLRDPYGNVVCLYFAGENRLNPPWRLQGN